MPGAGRGANLYDVQYRRASASNIAVGSPGHGSDSVQHGSVGRPIYTEPFVNSELRELVVRDLDRDGSFVIIDNGPGARDETARCGLSTRMEACV